MTGLPWRLRPYQERVLEELLVALRARRRALVSMPTGLGKTIVAAALIHRLLPRLDPPRVLVTAPYVPLARQHAATLSKLGVKVAAVTGSERAVRDELIRGSDVVVATPQTAWHTVPPGLAEATATLMNPARLRVAVARGRLGPIPVEDWRPWFGLLIVDEAHTAVGSSDARKLAVLAVAYNVPVAGFTATHVTSPERTRELAELFGPAITVPVSDDAVKPYVPRRYVSIVRVPAPPGMDRLLRAVDDAVDRLRSRVYERYGLGHDFMRCRWHRECNALKSLLVLRRNLVGSGVGAVKHYKAWALLPREAVELRDRLAATAWSHKLGAAAKRVELHVGLGRKVIVFAEAVEAARRLHAELTARGVKAVLLTGQGTMTRSEQEAAVEAFRGPAQVLVSTRVGHLGLDVPAADTEVWVDAPRNKTDFIQRFGRILRMKESALVEVLVTEGTGEERRVRRIIRDCERIYGFTVEYAPPGTLPYAGRAKIVSVSRDGQALILRLAGGGRRLLMRLPRSARERLGVAPADLTPGATVDVEGFVDVAAGYLLFRRVEKLGVMG